MVVRLIRLMLGLLVVVSGGMLALGELSDGNAALVKGVVGMICTLGLTAWITYGQLPGAKRVGPSDQPGFDALLGVASLLMILFFAITRWPTMVWNVWTINVIGLAIGLGGWSIILVRNYVHRPIVLPPLIVEAPQWNQLRERVRTLGYDRLSEPQKVYYAASVADRQIRAVGFAAFFGHAEGNHAPEAPTALELLGAIPHANAVRRALAVFGPSGLPTTPAARTDQLNGLNDLLAQLDAEYRRLPDDLPTLLANYTVENPRHFAIVNDTDDT